MDKPDEREAAFLRPTPQAAGWTLRPYSAGTMQLCRRLGLTMLTEGADPDTLDEEERQRQFLSYLFIQSQPLDEVLAATQDRERFDREHLTLFAFRVPIGSIQEIAEVIAANINDVTAAAFGIEPKPDERNEETTPPN